MAALKRAFRARANGGISPIEATRREEAVARAQAGVDPVKVLPPAMPHFGGPVFALVPPGDQPECVLHGIQLDGDRCGLCEGEALMPPPPEPAPVEQPRRLVERPIVTVTITGAPRSGRSVLSHVLISALAAEGIVVTVEGELRPLRWRGRGGALDNLVDRGVSVVLVKRESEVAVSQVAEAG